jgi:hypothetical protein
MTKAKTKSITLDVRSETKKGDAPKTEIQKMAAEIGRVWKAKTLLEKIERAASGLQDEGDKHFEAAGSVGREAERLEADASRRNDFLKSAILGAEAHDAIDALIITLVLATNESIGDNWVTLALNAKTLEERNNIANQYNDECVERERTLSRIIRGLCRGLQVTIDDIGMSSFWADRYALEFDAAVEDLMRRVIGLKLKIEG